MKTYISLLRGINVGGHNKIKMADLKNVYEELNFKNIRTYIQSGNVVFESASSNLEELSQKIEKKIQLSFGLEIKGITLQKEELEKIILTNPFRKKETKALYVMFLDRIPKIDPKEVLESVKDKSEEYVLSGKQIYFYYPNGYGKTKLSNPLIEKKLKVTGTTRNWNTINALVGL